MRKLMILAAVVAMVMALAAPAALALQGGGQFSTNVANADNDCDQSLSQSAIQDNDIDQSNLQIAVQEQDIAVDDITTIAQADDGGEATVDVAVGGDQSIEQVGNVAIPVQDVEQTAYQTQDCHAEANAFTLQFQNNKWW